jgi:nitrite reductase/ring-hydroxylating ferredoxin subunit
MKILRTNSLPINNLRYLIVGDNEIMVINLDNEFYCLEARCTHAGAPLFEGELNGDTIICPWHGSRFRITDGSIIKGPADESLKVYPGTVKNGFLYVQISEY